VNVIVTPGDYTDLTCCSIDDYDGTGRFGFRMTNQCGTWTGSGSCEGLGSAFDLTVLVHRVDGQCVTRVSSSLFAPIAFAGTLPAGMTGSAESDLGDRFDWEITPAEVVENPLIQKRCSPCSCATCLPRRLCVTVDRMATDYDAADVRTASGLWDCELKEWTLPEIAGVNVRVALKSIEERVCGLDVWASGAGLAGLTGEILLETGLHGRKIHGTLCRDSEDLISTLGVPELLPCDSEPCDDPPPQRFVSWIDETFALVAEDGISVIGTVRIQDQACGECEACGVQTCCLNRWPTTLYAEYAVGFTPGQPASVTHVPIGAIVPLVWKAGPFAGAANGYYGRLEGVPTYTTQPGDPIPQLDDFTTTVEFVIECDAGNAELSRLVWSRWQRSDLPQRPATDPPGPLTAYFPIDSVATTLNCHPVPDPLPDDQGLNCCDPPLFWAPSPELFYVWVVISA